VETIRNLEGEDDEPAVAVTSQGARVAVAAAPAPALLGPLCCFGSLSLTTADSDSSKSSGGAHCPKQPAMAMLVDHSGGEGSSSPKSEGRPPLNHNRGLSIPSGLRLGRSGSSSGSGSPSRANGDNHRNHGHSHNAQAHGRSLNDSGQGQEVMHHPPGSLAAAISNSCSNDYHSDDAAAAEEEACRWKVGTTDAVMRETAAVRAALAAITEGRGGGGEGQLAPPSPPRSAAAMTPLPPDDDDENENENARGGGEGSGSGSVGGSDSSKRRFSMPPHNEMPGRGVGQGKLSSTTLSALSQPGEDARPATAANSSASAMAASSSSAAGSGESVYTSLYQSRLFHRPHPSVDAVLSAACEGLAFDIAEVWLRTGPKTHQLTNSHLRPTSLEDSVKRTLVDVYYGEKSSERTHRLSPALCKRAKEAQDVVWVTASTERGAEALRCSISDVRTAVAVPVCHEMSRTNMTVIFFSVRRAIQRPHAVEFLVHMALAAAITSVTSIVEDIAIDQPFINRSASPAMQTGQGAADGLLPLPAASGPSSHLLSHSGHHQMSRSDRAAQPGGAGGVAGAGVMMGGSAPPGGGIPCTITASSLRGVTPMNNVSVTGAQLDLRWNALKNVEYLTDGGNNWIHTAVMNGRPVVVKTLKPECQDLALAINEIEGELQIHSKLDHPNIVSLVGAGTTSKGSRFVVLERLDGGTLTQMLGYDTRIRDRRRRFWKKKSLSYVAVLECARSIAAAMDYCHRQADPGCMVLHRDLKPSNIGFTLDGKVKLIDFGLARIVEAANPESDEVYEMSGETGSLRYMAPEVADCRSYNHKADVYSFGIILWEIVAFQKPFDGMSRDEFYARVVHGGERPVISRKWPAELSDLMQQCWDYTSEFRPTFANVLERLDDMHARETGTGDKKHGGSRTQRSKRRIISLIDRHSTWF